MDSISDYWLCSLSGRRLAETWLDDRRDPTYVESKVSQLLDAPELCRVSDIYLYDHFLNGVERVLADRGYHFGAAVVARARVVETGTRPEGLALSVYEAMARSLGNTTDADRILEQFVAGISNQDRNQAELP